MISPDIHLPALSSDCAGDDQQLRPHSRSCGRGHTLQSTGLEVVVVGGMCMLPTTRARVGGTIKQVTGDKEEAPSKLLATRNSRWEDVFG